MVPGIILLIGFMIPAITGNQLKREEARQEQAFMDKVLADPTTPKYYHRVVETWELVELNGDPNVTVVERKETISNSLDEVSYEQN